MLQIQSGATNQTWTDDRRFTKPMLYQLSYGGVWADCIQLSCLVKKFFYTRIMITILSVSDGHKHFSAPVDEYLKRTQKFITVKHLKPISHTNPEYIKVKETLLIMENLKKVKWIVILLDERGKGMSTREFTDMIEDAKNESTDITFVIGWSYWVDLEVMSELKPRMLRISDFVMPHGLAFLVVLEQIYRAHEIMKGSGYHHE